MAIFLQGSTEQFIVKGKCADGTNLFSTDLVLPLSSSTVPFDSLWRHYELRVDKTNNKIGLGIDGFWVEKSIQNCDFASFSTLYLGGVSHAFGACFTGLKLYNGLVLNEKQSAMAQIESTMAVEMEPQFCDKDITATLSDSDFSASSKHTTGLQWSESFARGFNRDFSISGEACCWKPADGSWSNSWLQIIIRPRPVRLTAYKAMGTADGISHPGVVRTFQVSYANRISGHMTLIQMYQKIDQNTNGGLVQFYGTRGGSLPIYSRLPYAIDISVFRIEILTYDTAPILRVHLFGCSSKLNILNIFQ